MKNKDFQRSNKTKRKTKIFWKCCFGVLTASKYKMYIFNFRISFYSCLIIVLKIITELFPKKKLCSSLKLI